MVAPLVALALLFIPPSPVSAETEEQRARDVEFLIKIHSKPYLKNKYERRAYRAIVMLESKDGEFMVGNDDPAFGMSQMKVGAVMTAAEYWKIKIPSQKDKIIWKLLKDNAFAIKMGSAYFGYLLDKQDRDIDKAIRSYNVGFNGEKLEKNDEIAEKYLKKVKKRMNLYAEELKKRSLSPGTKTSERR